ncbi:GCN5-related N-acetyltransferase [[Leptolyngbya] sp. PCC 7376]|uniref:GNAT family N-acetyltransferase n=1 Tax=[Leptolyngbya] sp. PCC 7376 TaxID=111781 RepID=UPI00029F1672|nr:GNAT family N-acetyltransferase [[Leptolyngbya] sp. PCC 7376]AFY37223.1 GCN5-related N-acetyltransferase [[Leptolyngbya] sp. PCC 7376]
MNLIKTSRLILRHAKQDDFDVLYNTIFSDVEVLRYVFVGGVLNYEKAHDFFESRFTFDCSNPYGLAVLVEQSTDMIIGFAGLIPTRSVELKGYEFGYVLSKQHWGKGYATEIAQGQISWALYNLDLQKIYALIHPQNKASIHVVEKLNLTRLPSILIEGQGTRIVYSANKYE